MSGVSVPAMASLFWTMLITGAGLAGFGLFRSAIRFREWKRIGSEDDGEVVFGERELQIGQPATIAPGERTYSGDSSGVISAAIAGLSRKHCVLELDPDADLCTMTRRGWPHIGENVTVSVTGATALYRFTARVRDVRPGSEARASQHVIVSQPIWLTRLQRRQHARVDLQMPVTFERVWSPVTRRQSPSTAALQTDAPLHGSVQNLSAGGVRAQIGGVLRLHELDNLLKLFAPETTIRLRLPLSTLPDGALLARVCTCERAASPGGLTLQVTCEFLPMPAWEQELVIAHVFRLQRELLKRG